MVFPVRYLFGEAGGFKVVVFVDILVVPVKIVVVVAVGGLEST